MIYKNYNENHDDRLIDIANELIDYKPKKVRRDKYFNFISRVSIIEMCVKNKGVIDGINHKMQLDLEDYTELLQAIGFVIKDCCKARFDKYCEQVKTKYKEYTIVAEHPIINIALGEHSSHLKWYLQGGKGKVLLVRYKENKKGELTVCRNTKDDMIRTVDVTDCQVIQIGRLELIVSDVDMKIYALSVDDEFLSIKKNADNTFEFCQKVA